MSKEPDQAELIRMAALRSKGDDYRNVPEQRLATKALLKGWTPIRQGWPDFLCFGPDGTAIVVECKPRNRNGELQSLRPPQVLVMNWLQSLGVRCYVSDGVHLEPYGGIAVHGRSTSTERVRRYRRRKRGETRSETPDETFQGNAFQEREPLGEIGVSFPGEGLLDGGTEGPQKQAKVPAETRRETPDPDWLLFRETYPKTDRTSWSKAEARFKALRLPDRIAALEGCKTLAGQNRPPEFRQGAQTWLNERRWETVNDWHPPSGNGNGNGHVSPAQAIFEDFKRRRDGQDNFIEGEVIRR